MTNKYLLPEEEKNSGLYQKEAQIYSAKLFEWSANVIYLQRKFHLLTTHHASSIPFFHVLLTRHQ